MRASNCRCQIQLARSLVLWIWSKLKGGSGRKEDRSPICNESSGGRSPLKANSTCNV